MSKPAAERAAPRRLPQTIEVGPPRRRHVEHLWKLYLGAGAVAVALYYVWPPLAGDHLLFHVIGLSSAVAVVAGIRLHRPATPAVWELFAFGHVLFVASGLSAHGYETLLRRDAPFPSVGDVLHLGVYPALVAGLIMLSRRRNPGGDRTGLIDAGIISTGVAVVAWVFLVSPRVHDPSLGPLQMAVTIGYPLMDVLLLAAAVRLFLDRGARPPSLVLMGWAIASLLVADGALGVITLEGVYEPGGLLEAGWAAYFLLWGTAALHDSMARVEEPAPAQPNKLTRVRLVALACASMAAPAARAIQVVRGEPVEESVVIVATMVLFGLVVARMGGLLHEYDRSVARERTLRQAGRKLVASSGREDVYAAALESMLSLVGPDQEARLCLYEGRDVVVAASGGRGVVSERRRVRASAIPRVDRDTLAAGRAIELDLGDRSLHHHLKLPYAAGHIVLLPLLVRDELLGFFVVAGATPFSRPVRDTLLALASQAALGVESAALTEDLLRRKSEARFQSLVQNSSDLITVMDADSTIKYQSPSIQRVLGFEAQQLVGLKLAELLHPHEADRILEVLTEGLDDVHRDTVECRLRHRDGSWSHFEIRRTNLLHDPNVAGIVLNSRDVTERKRFEDQLAHRAFHDPLTNLANRALFSDRVQHALSRKARDSNSLAVVFIDLDDFKIINDSLGHGAGDRVLVEASARMVRCMRPMDTLARFGGDEFAVLLEDVGGPNEVADVAQRILEALHKPMTVEDKEVYVNASMGIAMVEGDEALVQGADELMRNADVAMYMAKRDGKGGYRVFEPGMHVGVVERLELKGDLQRAIENGELELYYQPVVTLQTGRIGSVEALVRWNHPVRGLIAPRQFIPLAEETGLIVTVGRWVLQEACRQVKRLQELHPSDPPLGVGVNLSVRQLRESELVDHVIEALEGAELDPACLTLEITESVLMSDPETSRARLAELKAVGVRVAVDDFGTGYSSLSYLSQFPVDVLKIDRAFVEPVADGVEESALAAAIVKLGDALHLQTVAEGIEDPEQMDRLLQLGCVVGQGFLFAEPMPLDETVRFLDSARTEVPPEPVA